MAQRITDAEDGFVEVIMAQGFTREEAIKASRTMLRVKAAKLDAVGGRITVTHGAFLEPAAIRKAIDMS